MTGETARRLWRWLADAFLFEYDRLFVVLFVVLVLAMIVEGEIWRHAQQIAIDQRNRAGIP